MSNKFPLLCELISPAIAHLQSLDIDLELMAWPFVHHDQLDAFDAEFGIELPQEVRDLYAETDGFSLYWEDGAESGYFDFPSLYDLRLHRQNGSTALRPRMPLISPLMSLSACLRTWNRGCRSRNLALEI